MRTVNIGVEAREVSGTRFVAAMRGEVQGEFITFESVHLLLDTLTPDRWHILMALAGRGPRYVVEVHQAVGRPLDEVCVDVKVLVERELLTAIRTVVFRFHTTKCGWDSSG